MASGAFPQPSSSRFVPGQNAFLLEIQNTFNNVMKYENETLLKRAKSFIPLTELEVKAIHRMREVQRRIKEENCKIHELSHSEALLLELMNWFKNDFFGWVDSPDCSFCESPTKHVENTTRPSGNETIRVEVFKCPLCDTITDFPRYNDPSKLLETKKGRCGEWANCFMLFCRALSYDTRLVIDTKDHVWTEIYSYDRQKWLHCDPCENVMDQPLLYEIGWGKKLEYVIAYSKDDLQDVTWRYTTKHKDVLQRRSLCDERDLIDKLLSLRKEKCKNLSFARVTFLKRRTAYELIELMTERKPEKADEMGRISGSLSWRLQRKETKPWSPHTFSFEREKSVKIKYSTALDSYDVYSSDDAKINSINQWMNGAYEISNVFRKEEHDWKMVYLAREENSDTAKISWRFTANATNVLIDYIEIKVSSQTYESGCVKWEVLAGGNTYNIEKSQEKNFVLKDLHSVSDFKLSVSMSGGRGNLAWQHTQIFRQDAKSKECPFEVAIYFKQC